MIVFLSFHKRRIKLLIDFCRLLDIVFTNLQKTTAHRGTNLYQII
jgi:hypothetical protein